MLSVIIPTCNRNELLSKCLDLLSSKVQTISSADYEVIVTDDSKDNSAKSLFEESYDWVKWVEGPKRGPAANRNNGVRYAKGEWLVFIDDDCLPDKNILINYKSAIIQYPDSLAFEGTILPDDWELLKKDMSECPVNTEGNCFWSANICISKFLFKEIGGFDENYLIAAQEDQQLKIDVEKINGRIQFLSECIVIHPVRFTSLRRQLKKIPAASKNFCLYVHKNRRILKLNSIYKFAILQYHFHLKSAFSFMRYRKMKSLAVSIAWVIYGVPLNVLNMLKFMLKEI